MPYYDLSGTIGLAFYWWGADNPPSAQVQIILETPTGFWYSDFYDGPARWRYVLIPWGKFIWVPSPQRLLEPHRHGVVEPPKDRISGFIWTVHTSGIRRLDYVHAPKALPGPRGVFIARHSQIQERHGMFIVRHSSSLELASEAVIRHSDYGDIASRFRLRQEIFDIPASFTSAQGEERLPAQLISRHADSEDLPAGFIVRHGGSEDLPARLATPTGFVVFMREHKRYAAWSVLWDYSKPTGSIVRATAGYSQLGLSYSMFNVNREWIQGKYFRITWQASYTIATWGTRVRVMDGAYRYSSLVDFPNNDVMILKGNGVLQDALIHSGSFSMQTEEFQIDASGGALDMVTIMLFSGDSWNAHDGWYQVDTIEINEGPNGVGTLYREKFDGSLTMENTGTQYDYGYIGQNYYMPAIDSAGLRAGFRIRQDVENLKGGFTIRQGIFDIPSELEVVAEGWQNFDLYSEVDSAGDITRDGLIVSWDTMRRDANSWVSRDFGANFWKDFEFDFVLNISDVEAGDTSNQLFLVPIAVTNHGPTSWDHMGDGAGQSVVICYIYQNSDVDDEFIFVVYQREDGAATGSDTTAIARAVGTYYCTIGRRGTSIYMNIYTDPARTTLLEALSFVGTDTYDYRYIEATVSADQLGDPADHSTGYIKNLDTKRRSARLKAGFDIAP